MWFWIAVIISPFLLFLLIEEVFQLFVKRYMEGPFKVEGRIKDYFRRLTAR